jgi:hypothetical protein
MTQDEKFFAWLDGELSDAEAAEMEARVVADPELSRLAEQHRALGKQLRGAFSPVAAAPVPERLRTAAHQTEAEVIDFGVAERARSERRAGLRQWAALAATLVVGILVGIMVPQRAPLELHDGNIYAAASLDTALDDDLASAPSTGPVRIGLTFRDQRGVICRTFSQQASGLACRSGKRWQVRGLFAAPEGQTGDYRMAAGMDPNLAALVDSTIAGEPFDAAAEKTAKQRGWR